MSQLNLYFRTELETKVSLLPNQINGNMDSHILDNLRAKIEGKAIDNGIVLKINRIIEYGDGIIDKANFMGTVVFPVKYECFICSPLKNLEITCIVKNIIKGYLICNNGPVIIAIQFNNIDNNKFEIEDNTISNKNGNKIEKGDYLKISIISINNNLGEKNIIVMGRLINLASVNEIKVFNEDQMLIVDGSLNDTKEFI